MKNAFYFTSKAIFVPKIFKFFYWLFGHLSKRFIKTLNQANNTKFFGRWESGFKYFNGTIILIFCLSWFPILLAILISNLNEALWLLLARKSTIRHYYLKLAHLYSIAINLLMFFKFSKIFYEIIHCYYDVDTFCIIYFSIIYFTYAMSKWSTIFNYYIFFYSFGLQLFLAFRLLEYHIQAYMGHCNHINLILSSEF